MQISLNTIDILCRNTVGHKYVKLLKPKHQIQIPLQTY